MCQLFPYDDTLSLEDAYRHNRDYRRRQQMKGDDENDNRSKRFENSQFQCSILFHIIQRQATKKIEKKKNLDL